jgi:hypothetical protein
MDEEIEEEIIDQEIKNPVTPEELSQYLADRFNTYDMPGDQKIKPTAAEQLENAENRRRFL